MAENPEYQFQPGDTIVAQGEPFVKILSNIYKGELCDRCFRYAQGTLHRCANCKMMQYCEKACQKLDWKEGHSVECKSEMFKDPEMYKQGMSFEPNLPAKLFRTLAKFHLNPDSFSEKHLVYGDQKLSFNDLISSEESAYQHPGTSRFLAHFCAMIKSFDSSFSLVDFEEDFLRSIFRVWKTKEIPIWSLDDTPAIIGMGICIPHSGIAHSCRPNAALVGRMNKFEVRCIHPILKGEKPTFSLVAEVMPPIERKSILRMRYNVNCACEVCIAEELKPLLDYSQIQVTKQNLKRNLPSYLKVLELKEQGLKLYRQLYREYDHRITNFCNIAFDVICWLRVEFKPKRDSAIPNSVFDREAADVERRLIITFGEGSVEHTIYKQKLKEITELLKFKLQATTTVNVPL